MSATLILYGQREREKAFEWIAKAPDLSRITFSGPKRSIPQNDKLHALLTDISEQVLYHGQKVDVDSLKLVFLDGLKREVRLLPNLDNNGFVDVGRHTSHLDRESMSQLIELVYAWGAQHGVVFSGPEDKE